MASGRSSDIVKLTKAGINFVFNEAAKTPRVKQYEQIVTKVEEPKAIGIYETAGDIGNATLITEGDPIAFEGVAQGYETTITTLTYAKGVSATRRQMLDDQTNTVRNTFGNKLVNGMLNTKEQVVADTYNHAFATTGADGVYVISDSHPLLKCPGKLNDNLITGALSTENIKAAKIRFNFIYDQAGNRFITNPTHILIHPAKQFQLIELLQSQLMAWELSNTVNSLEKVSPTSIIMNDFLDYNVTTDVSPWFMLDKTIDRAGCILQTRGGMKLDTEEEFETKDWRGTCVEEYATSFVSPGYGIVGSVG